jgi:hypothetical protein
MAPKVVVIPRGTVLDAQNNAFYQDAMPLAVLAVLPVPDDKGKGKDKGKAPKGKGKAAKGKAVQVVQAVAVAATINSTIDEQQRALMAESIARNAAANRHRADAEIEAATQRANALIAVAERTTATSSRLLHGTTAAMAHLQADNYQLQEQLCSARAEARLHAQADAAAEMAERTQRYDLAIAQTQAASAADLAELNRLRTEEVLLAQVLASSKLEEADVAISQAQAASAAAIAATLNMSRSERKMLKRRAEAPIPTESPRTVGIQPSSTASSSTCLPPAVAPVTVATPMPMSVVTPASPATPSP